MPMVHDKQTLHLDVIAGPEMPRISVEPDGSIAGRESYGGETMLQTMGVGGGTITLGRSSQCEVVLADATISRRHAAIAHRAGRWMVTDLGSRHGTAVNGLILPEGQPTAIGDGETLAVGPWVFRCTIGDAPPSRYTETEESVSGSERIEAVPERELGTLAEQRLGLLLDCLTSIHQASAEPELAEAVVEAALRGTGFTRGALARPAARGAESAGGTAVAHAPEAQAGVPLTAVNQVELLGAAGDLDETGRFPLSRTLLRAAATGRVARLTDAAELREAVSVVELGIKSAICAPVHVGPEISAFLYLDTPHASGRVERDAAAFCGAIAQVCGMALSNIQRRKLEEQQKQLETDLRVARDAQRRMMPEERGEASGMPYAMRSIPGRVVAGDLFDIVELPGGKAAVLLGDVTGKGMGAALLMAMAQSQLNAALREHGDPHRAVSQVNRYLVAHSADTEFISLWLGVIDPEQKAVLFIDAGHGYCMVAPKGGKARRVESSRGLLIGIDPDFPYEVERLEYAPGDRLVLFSDGLVEQPPPAHTPATGVDFGLARTMDALNASPDVEGDVASLLKSLTEFSGGEVFNDDVTISSIELR